MSDELTRTNLVVDNNKLSPTLQCSICLDLVMEPVECQKCSKLFCKECINNWLQNSTQCPNKHQFIKKSTLDDWIKPALNRIFINVLFKDARIHMLILLGVITLKDVLINQEDLKQKL